MTQSQSTVPSRAEYEEALSKLIADTKGMRENIEPAVAEFRRAAGPFAEKALQKMVSSGHVAPSFHSIEQPGGKLDQIYQVFFSHMGDGERVMPDGVKVVWDAFCSCYVLSPEEQAKQKRP